jgi:hypothetical protein
MIVIVVVVVTVYYTYEKLNARISLTSLLYPTMKHDLIRGGPSCQAEF